jgi:hypothetical protein
MVALRCQSPMLQCRSVNAWATRRDACRSILPSSRIHSENRNTFLIWLPSPD